MEHLRRDTAEKCSVAELIETKGTFIAQLEQKVNLSEVQTALNECQQDICDQLTEFKGSV